jgi:hypothetical protein
VVECVLSRALSYIPAPNKQKPSKNQMSQAMSNLDRLSKVVEFMNVPFRGVLVRVIQLLLTRAFQAMESHT